MTTLSKIILIYAYCVDPDDSGLRFRSNSTDGSFTIGGDLNIPPPKAETVMNSD